MNPRLSIPPPREAYSVREVAEQHGVCRDTIYEEINDGHLKAVKVRNRTIIFRDALEAWQNSRPQVGRGLGRGLGSKNAK